MNSTAKKWLAMVQAEHAQTERLRDQPNPHDDHWHGMTVSFRADPHRTDDPLLDRLALRWSNPTIPSSMSAPAPVV